MLNRQDILKKFENVATSFELMQWFHDDLLIE
jgi:hypothetical protein